MVRRSLGLLFYVREGKIIPGSTDKRMESELSITRALPRKKVARYSSCSSVLLDCFALYEAAAEMSTVILHKSFLLL